MHDLLILGAGGHGRTLRETAKELGFADVVFLDDNESPYSDVASLIIGKISELNVHISGVKNIIVGIGNNGIRERLYQELLHAGIHPLTLIHPSAIVSPSAKIGSGSVILPGAIVGANTILGVGTIINCHSTVDHDAVLGDFAHLGVGVHLAGSANIGKAAFLQAGTVGGYNAKVGDYTVCPPGTIL
jgi:sugar O-acyltransferase (sialic acid O-acetyltransferase NeuD family)